MRNGNRGGRRRGPCYQGATTGTLAVCIPGGEVSVTVTDASSYLRGPSVLVAGGEISEEWWRAQQH